MKVAMRTALVLLWCSVTAAGAPRSSLLLGGNFTVRGFTQDEASLTANLAQFTPARGSKGRIGRWEAAYEPRLYLYGASGGVVLDMVVNDTAKRLAGEDYDALIIGGAFDSTCRTCQAQYCSVGAWEGRNLKQVGGPAGIERLAVTPEFAFDRVLGSQMGPRERLESSGGGWGSRGQLSVLMGRRTLWGSLRHGSPSGGVRSKAECLVGRNVAILHGDGYSPAVSLRFCLGGERVVCSVARPEHDGEDAAHQRVWRSFRRRDVPLARVEWQRVHQRLQRRSLPRR
mmetsp:Transcript_18017/g.68315  ORF Transcript_18017/g.68315 Transcript_18017/m.68315 type:complete len:285 (+) Transcript_18017:86-940(+)